MTTYNSELVHSVFWNLCLQSTILLSAAIFFLRCAKGLSAANRHMVAGLTLLALPVLPLASWHAPDWWRMAIPAPSSDAPAPGSTSVSPTVASAGALPVQSSGIKQANFKLQQAQSNFAAAPRQEEPKTSSSSAGLPWLLPAIWASAAGILALRQSVALVGLWRLSVSGGMPADTTIENRFRRLPGATDLPKGVRLVVDTDARRAAPVTWGAWRPILLLPCDITDWSVPQFDQVLIHEIEHIRRRDWVVQSLAHFVCVAFWFQPLAWLLYRTVRAEAELACDDAVLLSGAAKSTYAQTLLDITQRIKNLGGVSPALGISNRLDVSQRVQAILTTQQPRQRVSAGMVLKCAALIVVGLVGTVALRPMAQPHAKSDSPVNVFGEASRRLPGGLTVHLLGVGSIAGNTGGNWWRPDGSALRVPPQEASNAFHRAGIDRHSKHLVRTLLFEIDSNIDGAASTVGIITDPDGRLHRDIYHYGRDLRSNETVLTRSRPAIGQVSFDLPQSEKSITYRFGIATGPWETISAIRQPVFAEIQKAKKIPGCLTEGAIIELDSTPTLRYTSHLSATQDAVNLLAGHPPLQEVARRVIGIDSNGAEVPLGRTEAHDTAEQSVSLSDETLERIVEFRLQTRPYQWVEFPNVALQPSREPDLQVVTPAVLPTFKHTYACGITMEIPGVTAQRAGNRWWRPDGRIEKGPWKEFVKAVALPDMPRTATVGLARLTSRRAQSFGAAFELIPPENPGSAGIRHIPQELAVKANESVSRRFPVLGEPGTAKEKTLRYGIATGEWKTVATLPLPSDILRGPTPDFTIRTSNFGDLTLSLSNRPEISYRNSQGKAVQKSFLPENRSIGDNARRIIAIDGSGKQFLLNVTYIGNPGSDGIGLSFHVTGSLYQYNRLDLSKIKEFRLQTRPYEWAEFKQIRMEPSL